MLYAIDNSFMPSADGGHQPVLLEEVLKVLEPRAGARILDGTFGGGGHSRALLEASPELELVALDRDPEAEPRARPLADRFGDRFRFVRMNFGDLETLEMGSFDGIFFDFGLSSFQLDNAERGFSFRHDAPVDMRMDTESGQSAAEFLERGDEDCLIMAVRNYGEEPRWRKVVAAILQARGSGQLQRTGSLAELVAGAVGPGPRNPRGGRRVHPATRTFQGLRIAVNDELGAIERALPAAFDRLRPGGILAAISFHSLEDRIVKRFCRRMAGRPEHGRDSRTQDQRVVRATMIASRPIRPGEAELHTNPRSRSARLRALRRLNP
jgi:16S rRNA (cytosine1402-N4)-methyltransferase